MGDTKVNAEQSRWLDSFGARGVVGIFSVFGKTPARLARPDISDSADHAARVRILEYYSRMWRIFVSAIWTASVALFVLIPVSLHALGLPISLGARHVLFAIFATVVVLSTAVTAFATARIAREWLALKRGRGHQLPR